MGTNPFTIDVRGPANKGSIALPVTYTPSAGDPNEDGWNMVANPYPCAIDWDATAWTKTNINDATYIWNPDNQQYATYIAGVGTNGGSRNIAPFQAFWTQSNAASPVLNIEEACKVNVDQAFIRAPINNQVIRLSLANATLNDETVIRFDANATDTFDRFADAHTLHSSAVNVPRLGSIINGEQYSINTMSALESSRSIPLLTEFSGIGNFDLAATDISGIGDGCIILEDVMLGTFTDLRQDSSYNFTFNFAQPSPRFILHLTPEPTIDIESVSCHGSNDGQITATIGGTAANFVWTNLGGDTLRTSISQVDDALQGLSAGSYIVTIDGMNTGCAATSDTVEVSEPAALGVLEDISDETCIGCCDGTVNLTPTGGVGPFNYTWMHDNTLTSGNLDNLCIGVYEVEISDANGCYFTHEVRVTGDSIDVGVNEFELQNKPLIYPNPGTGEVFNLAFTNTPPNDLTIQVIDGTGRTIPFELVRANNTLQIMPSSTLSTGVYFIQGLSASGTWSQPVVIK